MRHIALLMGFLLLLSAIHADISTHYEQDGLYIERIMQIRPINSISPFTGAVRTLNGTLITLVVTNRGPSDRHNLSLEEDLTYLPAYIRIIYSIQPSHTDGRKVLWDVGDLPSGRRFEVSFSLPTPVSDAAVASAKPPVVRSARPPAELIAPNLVDRGQTVVLRLTTPDGIPIGGAQLELIEPDGTRSSGVTDELGRFVFVADQTGFYTYSLPNFAAFAIPATESRVAVVVAPPTTGSITPVNASGAAPLFSVDAVLGLWPFAGGLLIVGLLAFGIYGYFNRPARDDGPTPPAPALRPPTNDMGGGASTMLPPSSAADRTASASGPTIAASFAPDTGMRMPPPVSTSTSSAMPGAAALSSGGPAVLSQTRDLLAARRATRDQYRGQPQRPASDAADEGGEDEGPDSGKSSSSDFGSKPDYGEETTMAPERPSILESHTEEKEDDERKDSDAPSSSSRWTEETATSDATDADEAAMPDDSPRSKSTGSPPPAWMTQEALSGEQVEVDDEAITKTITELEALRSELKSRAKARVAAWEGTPQSDSQASAQSSGGRQLEESFDELDKLGQEIEDETSGKEAQEEALREAAAPEASDEEISESIAPADMPTVSEAAEAGEEGEGEETGAAPEQAEDASRDEQYSAEPDSSEPSEPDDAGPSPPPAPSPRTLIRNAISISPIPPRMRRQVKKSAKSAKESVRRLAAKPKLLSPAPRKKAPVSKQASAPLKRGPAKQAAGKKAAGKTKKR